MAADISSKSDELSVDELERIISKEQTNIMLGNNLEHIDIEEKEKYRYWRTFNKLLNMIKIELLSIGSGATGVFYI